MSMTGGFLLTLIGGLAGYDESLYREWLLNHPDERARAESDSDSGLSFHGFTQDTSLLLGIYNQVGLLVSGTLQFKDGKHPEFKPIMPLTPPMALIGVFPPTSSR